MNSDKPTLKSHTHLQLAKSQRYAKNCKRVCLATAISRTKRITKAQQSV